MDYLYIVGLFATVAAIVGAGFKAFGLDNEEKVNKLFKINN